MNVMERVAQFARTFFDLRPYAPIQTREMVPDGSLESFFQRLGYGRTKTWQPATIRDALGVPAIYAAVNLIASTASALTLRAYRHGLSVADEERPRLIIRPDPFTTPREFIRATTYSMATRGEAWWWIAKRDIDGLALSLLPLNPAEIVMTPNHSNPLRPKIEWRSREMPNEDMVQIVLSREPGALRGAGPLQMCGAAISVAVEAQEWAANYYAGGGVPPLVIKYAGLFGEGEEDEEGERPSEAEIFAREWMSKPMNQPRTVDQNVDEFIQLQQNAQGGQMLAARDFMVGEVATMFNLPASLLNHAVPGTSLTYQNVGMEFDKFIRMCLWPSYLEPIEQAISDLLSRNFAARFNTEGLLRADMKTRFEVYKLGIDTGVLTEEEARAREGIEGGDVENAPVPFSPPQAIPTRLPIARSQNEPIRCAACGRSRMIVYNGGAMRCVGCKREVAA